jgi:uncharacterized protein (TIGR02145 family)
MKRILIIIVSFCVLTANAQNYLISFEGSGASTTVSSVKVENLTKGTILTINGSDILHLTPLTGINSIEDNQSAELKIYPNPTTDNATMEVFPPIEGNAVISVNDMTGKQVAQIQSYLENSKQEFRLSGLEYGVYLISVKGRNYNLSGKLLCNGKSNGKVNVSVKKDNNIIQVVNEKVEKITTKGTQATHDLEYTIGDRLKFTGISGNYSTVKVDIPESDRTINFNFVSCSDGDGNNYPVVEIGTQIWMAENLKTTRYRNGNLIGTTTPATLSISGETTPKYQWPYNGDEGNASIYGRLYTWLSLADARNLCPTGWHVPTDAEWTTLSNFLGGNSITGGKLKETGTTHWMSPNTGASNESGFTALPGGFRSTASFINVTQIGHWWSSTFYPSYPEATGWTISNSQERIYTDYACYIKEGRSVRCVLGQSVITIPFVLTSSISNISLNTATCGGIVYSDGGANIISRGICWNTSTNPTISNSKTNDGTGTGSFESYLTGLAPNTKYYVRSYARNSAGTAYGPNVIFTTKQITLASLTTTSVTSVDLTTAVSGGNITSDGGGTITARGVCWATTENPTISNGLTVDGIGIGSYTSTLSALIPGTTYYVRAYATNSAGTAYGNEVSFTTLPAGMTVTDIDGNIYNTVSIGSQVWMAENLKTTKYNDNTTIPLVTDNNLWAVDNETGYCWYNNDISSYKDSYGALYKFYTLSASSNGGKNVCPTGWHVPSSAEWVTLVNYLLGNDVAGGKLKETGTTHWLSPNTGATNESGFTALPGGYREIDGRFSNIGTGGYWWTSTWGTGGKAPLYFITNTGANLYQIPLSRNYGFSVRCIKD